MTMESKNSGATRKHQNLELYGADYVDQEGNFLREKFIDDVARQDALTYEDIKRLRMERIRKSIGEDKS